MSFGNHGSVNQNHGYTQVENKEKYEFNQCDFYVHRVSIFKNSLIKEKRKKEIKMMKLSHIYPLRSHTLTRKNPKLQQG